MKLGSNIKNVLFILIFIPLVLLIFSGAASAANVTSNQSTTSSDYQPYQIGNPVLTDLWVDPVGGNDLNSGNNATKPLKTLSEAWNRIPSSTVLTQTGYRIMLMPGTYREDVLPSNGWMESRYGTYNCPIIIQPAYSTGPVNVETSDILNFYNCRYIYLIGLNLQSNANNVLHLEKCDHILLKNLKITGLGNINDYNCPQEDLKANQCQNIYLENSDVSNAWNVPVDFVAVESGHIIGNKIHQAGDWCIYLKGGSSHFIISGNEIYNAVNGGFTAGQGTGFEWMVPPYIHYEAYDIKFVNNIIHDTHGAGMGVNGGYNILLAYNTLYRVGDRSHALEFLYGIRSCGDISKCQYYLSLGGWGTAAPGDEQRIPNKNVYVYNNILYNPDGYSSQWSQFALANPVTPASGSNIPSPSRTDDNLLVMGNIIWNGPSDLPLGIEDITTNLNPSILRSQNAINTLKPQLIDPDHGNFRPLTGGNVFTFSTYSIPNFPGNDYPTRPLVNPGNLNNNINTDYNQNYRDASSPPGAYYGSSAVNPPTVSANPHGGSFNSIQTVTLSMNRAGTIYYTTDSSNPTISSSKYTSPLTLNTTTILKFMGIDNAGIKSGVITETYTINMPQLSINSTNPRNNTTGVSISIPVTLNFSQNIYSGTNYSGVYIKNLNSGALLSITKIINGSTLTINHVNPFKNNTTYQLYIPAGAVKDASGKGLSSTYIITFNTVAQTSDTTPPSVKITSPINGATGVSLTIPVTITFNENIQSSVNYSGIYIKNLTTGKIVSLASKTISGSVLTLKMTSSRLSKNNYVVYIPAGAIKDLAGNNLAISYSIQFKTV